MFSLCAVIHYALHHDKPELRKPNHFDADQIPESLRAVLSKGMEANPRKRFLHAEEMLSLFRDAKQRDQAERLRQEEAKQKAADETKRCEEQQQAEEEAKRKTISKSKTWIAAFIQQQGEEAKRKTDQAEGLRQAAAKRKADDEKKRREEQQQADQEAKRKASTRYKCGDVITNSLGMKFAWVPPGTSWLGGWNGTPGQEQFTLDKGLWCGVYPVTQAEWKAVLGDEPSHFEGKPRHPVESVSWNRVQEFLEKLNAKSRDSGLLYRLPTEQEWEYICRGGPLTQDQSKYHFYFAKSKTDLTPTPTNDLSSKQANFDGNHPAGSAVMGPYLQATSEVGLYLPNPLGIYDLVGNVWEWTSSLYESGGSDRVIRGGSWGNGGVFCTAAYRSTYAPGNACNGVGFRLLAVPVG